MTSLLQQDDSDLADKSGRVYFFVNKRRKPVRYYKHKFSTPEKGRTFYRWLNSLEIRVTNCVFQVMQRSASSMNSYFEKCLGDWRKAINIKSSTASLEWLKMMKQLIQAIEKIMKNEEDFYGNFTAVSPFKPGTRYITVRVFKREKTTPSQQRSPRPQPTKPQIYHDLEMHYPEKKSEWDDDTPFLCVDARHLNANGWSFKRCIGGEEDCPEFFRIIDYNPQSGMMELKGGHGYVEGRKIVQWG